MAKKYNPVEADELIQQSLDRANKLYCEGNVESAVFAMEEVQALADVARYRQMEADKAEHQKATGKQS